MRIVVPVDTSECSMRALSHALEIAEAMDATIDVVHFSEFEDEATADLKSMIEEVLAEFDVDAETEIVGDIHLSDFQVSRRIGENILKLVEKRGYDQIVMGHHGAGLVDEVILGSAAKKVVKDSTVPVTVVP